MCNSQLYDVQKISSCMLNINNYSRYLEPYRNVIIILFMSRVANLLRNKIITLIYKNLVSLCIKYLGNFKKHRIYFMYKSDYFVIQKLLLRGGTN